MNYSNSPRDNDLPDMPAVSPLDLPAHVEPQPQQARRRITPKSPRQALQPETVPPPPPRSQKARHPLVVVLNFFLMIVVLGVLTAGGVFYFGKREFSNPGPLTEQITVPVAEGSSLSTIADQLERHNVIDSPLIFTIAARLYDAEDELRAGEYLFQPGASMERVLNDLITGRSVLNDIVFPEGFTSQKIVDRLNADTRLTGTIAAVPAEGSLMPNTYKFTRGATRMEVLSQMQQGQERLVAEIWARRDDDLPIDTVEEFVTLASIVEKETGRADERPRVAAVFINRLRQGMRLDSDPTVIYGLFGGAGKPADRPIYQSDLQRETPYNTYKINGLPPGPIANPGRAALEAVANPSRTDELYFVADGTGGHAFAATLEEHNRNVERWRQIEAVAREAEAAQQTLPAAADQPAVAEEPAADDAGAEEAPTEEPTAEPE
jgi:UPF0755 protein